MTTSDWFSTEPTHDDRRTAFLQTLAAAAEQWTFADLSAADTTADLGYTDGRVLVAITVPGLSSNRRNLRVQYISDVEGRPVMESAWAANPYPVDEYEDAYGGSGEGVDLRVSGVEATPEQCAVWAAAWFQRQLSRRVTRREWDRPTSGVSLLIPTPDSTGPVAVEWSIESPDHRLDTRGGFTWWWLMRRPPTRTVVERPGTPAQG